MNKIIKRDNIGWGNNKFNDEVFTESNNNWFIFDIDTVYDMSNTDDEDKICDIKVEKLKQDSRLIYNDKLDSFIVNQQYVDDIEKEYEVEFNSIINLVDTIFGDWEQDYDRIGKHFNIDEHQAYEMVGDNIKKVIENIALLINTMSDNELKNLNYEQLEKLEYGYFSKFIYNELLEQIKFIEDNYRDML